MTQQEALQRSVHGGGSVGAARPTLPLGQLLRYYAAWLPKPGNYPRLARRYAEYCLREGFALDAVSFRLYAAGQAANRVSPLKKFLLFYQMQGSPVVVADPPRKSRVPPAANELILGYLNGATHLRGEETKASYTGALNAFFAYLTAEQEGGRPASFSGLTVGRYVQHLKGEGYSAFTVNFYLSAVKQLAAWVIAARQRLNLTPEQVDALRDVAAVRGLRIERRFYKESLSRPERDALLAGIGSARERAIVTLLVVGGLRTVEVTRLTLGDVDLPRGRLEILGKGRHTKKAVVLLDKCAEALREYLHERGGHPAKGGEKLPLFPELKTHQVRYIVDKHLRSQELKRPKISAHSLRHTTGQLMLDEGVELTHVQRHLRHEVLETTQFYVRQRTERAYFEDVKAKVG